MCDVCLHLCGLQLQVNVNVKTCEAARLLLPVKFKMGMG